MKPITADQFIAQLRTGGCRVGIDRSIPGVAYVRVESVHGDPTWGIYAVFEGDRFQCARDVKLGVSRRHWRTYRSMAAVLRTLGVEKPKVVKPRTLRRNDIGDGYVTSDGRYEVAPAYTPPCTSLGGNTMRPSYWILTDLQGEYKPVERTLLSDIRDLLKERP